MEESPGSGFNTDNSIHSNQISFIRTNTSFEYLIPISQDIKSKIIKSIVINLDELIIENRKNNEEKFIRHDLFYLGHIPSISLSDYIHRLVKYTKMNISSLILSVIYLDKFCEAHKYILSLNNIHRLLLASCLLSIKFNEDITVNTKYYAEIAGVSVNDLNSLEFYLYVMLDFSLFVDYNYFQKYFDYFSKYTGNNNNKKGSNYNSGNATTNCSTSSNNNSSIEN